MFGEDKRISDLTHAESIHFGTPVNGPSTLTPSAGGLTDAERSQKKVA